MDTMPYIKEIDPEERYRSHGYRWPAVIPRRWLPSTSRSDKSADRYEDRKPRSTLVIAVVSVVTVVSLIAIGVAAAIVIMNENKKTLTEENTDTYTMSITLSQPFVPELLDQNSQEFHTLAEATCDEIERIYLESEVSNGYEGCVVQSFRAGSTIVNYTLVFTSDAQIENRNSPAGSDLTPMEYTLMMIVEEKGNEVIPGFTPGSTTIATNDQEALNVTRMLDLINKMEADDNCGSSPCLHGGSCTDGLDAFFCACTSPYTGNTCGIDITECSNTVCSGHGSCVEVVGGDTVCQCDDGYTSSDCSVDIDDCSPNPCLHGSCTDGVDSFTCACDAGYEGDTCGIDTDECFSSPCAATGTCQDQVNAFICICDAGYDGTLCGNNVDDCSPNPCLHGSCTDGVDSFTCSCDAGYEGDSCGIDTNECSSNPCASTGRCEDQVNGYICICNTGYDGTLCNNNIDDCSPNPCLHGSCTDGVDSFSCSCDAGYEGDTCGIDTDECSSSPCAATGTCQDQVNAFICICDAGYDGTLCGNNVDDCSPNPCLHGSCTDGVNSFTCSCDAGYEGDTCGMDTDECSSSPCAATGTCQDQVNAFICICDAGYDGTLCGNNVDDCSPNPCLHGSCTDGVDSFTCSCDAGYEGDTCGTDTDECTADPCASTGTCEDQVNGYICICNTGYDGTLCNNNIDDCSPNPCLHGSCTDGVDSFTCSCDAGYEGDTCGNDTDDCAGDPCASTGTCEDQLDGYLCLCDSGYTGALCDTDIDDCTPDYCVHGTCSDTGANSFSCDCDSGYEGDTCGINTDDCLDGNGDSVCTGNGTVCYDLVGSYICTCPPGFVGDDCEINIDECASNPCADPHICVDKINSFVCQCAPGFIGTYCEGQFEGFNNIDWGWVESCPAKIDYCCLNRTVVQVPEIRAEFYSYGVDAGDDRLAQEDDGCPASYDFPTVVFGIPHDEVYVCYNGMVSLDGPIDGFVSDAFPLTTGYAVFAAYWTDLDMRCSSTLWTRIDTTDCTLDKASSEVQKVYGGNFQATRSMIITWLDATTWDCSDNTETVDLQMVIVTDDIETYVMYIYGDMQWGISPQVGFDAGDGINYYSIDGSRTDVMLDIETTSNINIIGKYMFSASSVNITAPVEPVCGDPCNGNGGCTSNTASQDFTCTCFQGFTGDDCLTGSGSC